MFSKKEIEIFYHVKFDLKFALSKEGRRATEEASNTVINQLRR